MCVCVYEEGGGGGKEVRTSYYCSHSNPPPAESINDYVGLGFSGYDTEGKPVWDVCKNVRLLDAEVGHVTIMCFLKSQWYQFGTNFREVISGWNVTSSLWLRR